MRMKALGTTAIALLKALRAMETSGAGGTSRGSAVTQTEPITRSAYTPFKGWRSALTAAGGGHDAGDQGGQGEIQGEEHSEGQTLTKYRPKVKKPSLYKVILLNDDFTPQDFVVYVLRKFFNKAEDEAMRVMLQVHHQGAGIAGVFSFEVAETKVYLVNEFSRSKQHPLKCIMEKESAQDED